MRDPLGLNDAVVAPAWEIFLILLNDEVSQSLIGPDKLTDAMRDPSGLNCTSVAIKGCTNLCCTL